MAYGDTLLGANHRWSFNNILTDSVGSLTVTNTGGVFVTTPITRDATHSYQTNGRDDLATVAPAADSGASALDRYAFQGWFQTNSIQGPPTLIYGQGGSTAGFALFLAWGNSIMMQFTNDLGNTKIQIYSDIAITNNRSYHFFVRFSGNGFSDEVEFYLDGVKQTRNKDGVAPGTSQIAVHTSPHTWGENGSAGTTIPVGTLTVLIKAPVNGLYSEWWTWSGADAEAITDTQISDDLFGAGAIPEYTIVSDSESNMQSALNALPATFGDEPLNILIEEVSGGGDLNLDADGKTFNSRSSMQVRYEGSGTLFWTNTNGTNAERGSANVTFINPAVLTVANLVVGTEVRIYDDNGVDNNDMGTELAGIESTSGSTFTYNHSGATNTVIIQIIRSGYFEILQRITLSAEDQQFSFIQILDNNT